MAFCDFVVKYDPEKDKPLDITKRILYSVVIKRLKAHKPVVMFVGGDSGEGKSITCLRLQQLLLEIQGLDIRDHMDDINVYIPIEYPEKLRRLLFDKSLKKVNIICTHEAREIVKAKLWYDFLNRSIADINAMSRSVKRLCNMVVSQFIRDISPDIRYTLTYYCVVRRPKNKPARLYINVLWKDDRDLEKPKLRRRKLSGYLVYPNGRYRRYIPQYFEMTKPPKDLVAIFEKRDYEAKAGIIKGKIDKLIQEMKADMGVKNNKIELMVDWYVKHQDNLNVIGRKIRDKWIVKPEVKKMHDLTVDEAKEFQSELNKRIIETNKVKNEIYEPLE